MFTNPKRQIYTSLLNMANEFHEYPQKHLSGLGKSTKRGIKKCTNCGIYNGTRSSVCKNKQCARVLKTSEEKSNANLEAVQLLTNTEKQVYSVRIWDMGLDYRGFVQLPVLQSCSEENSNIYSEVALCFVDSCQNSFDNSILKCHEEGINTKNNSLCSHIKSALKSQSKALPLQLDHNLLNSLKFRDEHIEKLNMYGGEKEGPFVQKVSKSVMAVKCQVNAKHPLGYLHFTFIKGKGKETYEKFYCSCSEFSVSDDEVCVNKQKCLHYYACIWALASEDKQMEEFSTFLTSELSPKESTNTISNSSVSHLVEDNASSNKNLILATNPVNLKMRSNIIKKIVKKSKLQRKKETIKRCQKIMPKILPIEIKVLDDTSNSKNTVSWEFIDWLSFVTESINSTMQFENYGIVNTMVLQIPEDFYNSLAKRIPIIYQVLQNGNCFIRYVMNILHLKEIFDTPKVKLKISKKFVHNDQKGYIEFDENDDSNNEASYQCPFIYFLNVGQSTVDESDNTNNSFYIEWTPSLFNVSNIGQLRLQYKYGRKST